MVEQLPSSDQAPVPGVPLRKSLQVSRTVAVLVIMVTLIVGLALGAEIQSLASGSDQPEAPEGFPRDGQSAFGNGGPPGRGQAQNGLTGTVTAVGNGSLTLSASDGTWTVSVGEGTQFGSPRDESSSSSSDVAVGDQIIVLGKKDSTAKTVTAERIMKAPQGSNGQPPSAI